MVENRAGAGGLIAAQALKTAAPDGNTFFLSHDHTISILPLVMKNPGFEPAPASVPDFVENYKARKVHIVAVLGATRQAVLPDVPTFSELGLAGFEGVPCYGFFAPAGSPKVSLDKCSDALAKVLAMLHVREPLTAMGLSVGFMPQQPLASREHAGFQAQ